MAQIKFFKKAISDIDNPNIDITVTDSVASSTGLDIVNFIRNRNNRSAWRTTDSTDAGTTTLTIDMADTENFNRIFLLKNNWGAFTVKYWSGAAYIDFSTPISEAINAEDNNYYEFDAVDSNKIQIIITGTQVANEDKELYQLIITSEEGQLNAWPEISNPRHVSLKQKTTMLSGKINVIESVGRFSCSLKVPYWKNDADLTLVEDIYFNRLPVLVWLCGGDETQFRTIRRGYRLEDIYLMRPTNDYSPKWYSGVYSTGLELNIKLDEVVD